MMIGTMLGSRAGGDPDRDDPKGKYDTKKSLDPYVAQGKAKAEFVTRSGALGPRLLFSQILFSRDAILLADVIAVVGRIRGVNSVADWRNLPSAKLPGAANPDNPPMWLPRSAFKTNIRSAKFSSWPLDPKTGKPVGGEELRAEGEGRISKYGASIGDAALDAVFDTWAWGASVATPDKVESQLKMWRESPDSFRVGKFTGAVIRGRSVTGIGIVTFIVIQVIAYGTLFIAPFLRVFFNVDIGFGQLGSCNPGGCVTLF